MRPQTQTAAEKEQKASHRRTLPATLMKVECQPSPFQVKDVKSSRGRSYMNPTTSSKAKISRSVSVGENLNLGDTQEPSVGSDGKQILCEADVGTVSNTDAEKNNPAIKDNAAFKPLLQPSANNSLPKTLQSKNRAHLTLDIGKPLPDRPLLSFSRSRSTLDMESPRSPRSPGCSWKPRLTFTELACRNDNPVSGGSEQGLLESPVYTKGSPEDVGPINTKMNPTQDKIDFTSDIIKPITRGRASTIGHTPDNHSGLCPVETIRPRSPSLNAASTLNSGGQRGPPLVVSPFLSPICVGDLPAPSHLSSSSLWPVSSCAHLSCSISHPKNGEACDFNIPLFPWLTLGYWITFSTVLYLLGHSRPVIQV